MNLSDIFTRNADAYFKNYRKIKNRGGTSSSKTFSILQLLTLIAIPSKEPLLISVMSESMPHAKSGTIRDFKKILGSSFDEKRFSETDKIYDFGNAQLEFFSSDNPGKVHGPRRDILFVNEVNYISRIIVDAASIRTARCIFYDFNPVSTFWLTEEPDDAKAITIHSTYKDAIRFLPAEIVADIESRRLTDPNWWNVYGLGEIGNVEGLVHPYFSQIEQMPDLQKGMIEIFGLDFGYTNDPSVIVRTIIDKDKKEIYSDELIYETGLNNQQLCEKMGAVGVKKNYDEIIADCAEPKSIDEINERGFLCYPCLKGPDSVIHGVQLINQYKQFWTKRSVKSIKEQRNYSFLRSHDGKVTNKIIDANNHSMDGRRYSVNYKLIDPGIQIF